MAKIIKANGKEQHIVPRLKIFTLGEMQKAIGGGYIETVCGTEYVFCDEDGKSKNLPLNKKATELFGFELVGDILICSKEECV